jgi:hypothetical protein
MAKTIGVIGSNGKVGTEVSLLLACMNDTSVAPVSRSEYGAAFLKRCGLAPRLAPTTQALADALADCDLVVDLSSSLGRPAKERRQRAMTHIRGAIASCPTRAPFVFASSITAFGMRQGERDCRHYRISRTSSGADRRREEREVFKAAASLHRRGFVLRLGEVHGDLQPVTSYYVRAARQGVITVSRGLHRPSAVVTCFTIAQALRTIARGKIVPGRYTLVEHPEWSCDQFYRWVAANSGTEVLLEERPAAPHQTIVQRTRHQVARGGARLYLVAARNRDVITAYLPISPQVEYRLQIEHLKRKALSEVAQRPVGREFHDLMLGPAPGRRLPPITDTEERIDVECRVRQLLDDQLSPQSHNFQSGAHWAPEL